MRDLPLLLLSTFLMTLYLHGAEAGDILLSEEQRRIIYGSGIITHNAELVRRWPNGRIPYHISKDPSSHEVIKKAMKIFKDNTCIEFVPRVSDEYYVKIEDGEIGEGCSAYVGKIGFRRGYQEVTLENHCLNQRT